jgi:hypothetical protein
MNPATPKKNLIDDNQARKPIIPKMIITHGNTFAVVAFAPADIVGALSPKRSASFSSKLFMYILLSGFAHCRMLPNRIFPDALSLGLVMMIFLLILLPLVPGLLLHALVLIIRRFGICLCK